MKILLTNDILLSWSPNLLWQIEGTMIGGFYESIYRVQMPNITPHVCRHTYCSNMASIIHLPRQEVAFSEECRKIKGCGSLREDFYTGFIPEF